LTEWFIYWAMKILRLVFTNKQNVSTTGTVLNYSYNNYKDLECVLVHQKKYGSMTQLLISFTVDQNIRFP